MQSPLTTSNIAHLRLINQAIAATPFTSPHDAVASLGAVQAQDYDAAKWSIGCRTHGGTAADVESAIAARTIVRTWMMRGTLHIVAAEDVHWMHALLSERIIAATATRERNLEFNDTIFGLCRDLFIDALQGGNTLTRDTMLDLLEGARISTANNRGYHILWRLSQEGLLCCGPHEGKTQTFVLLDEWIPAATTRSREQSLAELAKRYFTSHGPATLRDFVWWSGLKVSDAKVGLHLASPELAQLPGDDGVYWMRPQCADLPPEVTLAYLLPGYDEFMLGYADRSASLDPQYARLICPGGNGIFAPIVVVDGQVKGTWRMTVKKAGAIISFSPFHPIGTEEKQAIDMAAERYCDFLGKALISVI